MPLYDPQGIEYGITSGHIQIVPDGGRAIPAFWAHPMGGSRLPAIALIHDWWGITPFIRRMAAVFAQNGYYVIVPDLFEGRSAASAEEAIELLRALGDQSYPRVDAAVKALEQHHKTNSEVAVVGLGMGGSLAFEAAIRREDLEAAVAYYGFPQRYFNRLKEARTPVLAVYGAQEPHVPASDVERLRATLRNSTACGAHELLILPNAGRDFFSDGAQAPDRDAGRAALNATLTFLAKHLARPTRPLQRNI